jgi:Flp pilus assembly pilin Flp
MRLYGQNRVEALCRRFAKDESGPTATEYAILLAVLILGSVGVIGAIGNKFAVLYTIIANAMPEGFA